ncbi:hypothetical protein [Mycobacterium sp. GA-1285]|uniref:hypothetical protein n=1 Tax=Mycobacterium sp. GA-1285 TaxID=1772282 RepID=UPI000AC60E1E|nr:hypothetical protein [Mycobacterium sp. GA-1285]
MNIRPIATRFVAGAALIGALAGIGTGVAAGTANAKPKACAGMERQLNDAIYLAHAAHDDGDYESRNWYFDVAERINRRYEAAGCRS